MKLTVLALITTIIGIILLIFLSNSLEPKLMDIEDISGDNLDEYVKVTGEITKIKNYPSFTVFTIKDETEDISVIIYQNVSLPKKVSVIGKVTSYKGMLEIEAEKITEN